MDSAQRFWGDLRRELVIVGFPWSAELIKARKQPYYRARGRIVDTPTTVRRALKITLQILTRSG